MKPVAHLPVNITLQERITFLFVTSEYHALNALHTKLFGKMTDNRKEVFHARIAQAQRQFITEVNTLCSYCIQPWHISSFSFRLDEARTALFSQIYKTMLEYENGYDYIQELERDQNGYYDIECKDDHTGWMVKYKVGRDTLFWLSNMVWMREHTENCHTINSPALQIMQKLPMITKFVDKTLMQYKPAEIVEPKAADNVVDFPSPVDDVKQYNAPAEKLEHAVYSTVVGTAMIDLITDYALTASESLEHLKCNIAFLIEESNPDDGEAAMEAIENRQYHPKGIQNTRAIVMATLCGDEEKPVEGGITHLTIDFWVSQLILGAQQVMKKVETELGAVTH